MGAIYNLNPTQAQQPQPPIARSAKTPVAASITTTASTPLVANTNRASWSIYNAGPATVFLREGTTVAATLYEKPIPPGFDYDGNDPTSRYTGAVSLITASGTANVLVSESVYS